MDCAHEMRCCIELGLDEEMNLDLFLSSSASGNHPAAHTYTHLSTWCSSTCSVPEADHGRLYITAVCTTRTQYGAL